MPIPVIDLFAGPGGLGEGFSALKRDGKAIFKIQLSIEKELHAHRTLELRAFFRQFDEAPDEYYHYLRGNISRADLFKSFATEAGTAAREAWHAELGSPAFPNKLIDQRIRAALGDCTSWVLIGGPPCQAYSLVGRSRIIGEKNGLVKYERDRRHHLYRRYLRILAVHKPPVFIMENVKGLLSAMRRKQPIFERILRDLKNPPMALTDERGANVAPQLSYRLLPITSRQGDLLQEFTPEDFVVPMEDYGIPQTRHRIIVLGIRSDIDRQPGTLQTEKPVHIEQAVGDLLRLRSGISKEPDDAKSWCEAISAISHAKWVISEKFSREFQEELRRTVRMLSTELTRGAEFVSGTPAPKFASDWFSDARLGGFCNHTTRSHIKKDLQRYFFVAVFGKVHKQSPGLEDFPPELLPNHHNVSEALEGTKFNDRFRVQLAGRYATTVVSHIAKDGHYYIHYDPTQCRSLTVREAARIQTFPDNYFFEGPRTQQYHQVGNAVPPLLAKQIAEIVCDLFE
jgi:DNA (cytosine-5)-methyltransferase 1